MQHLKSNNFVSNLLGLKFAPIMNKDILRLALPNIISNITVPLLGMVDMYLVGHLDSEEYIGAIAVATTIFNFIYWNFSFLRMGTSGFTAQAFGAENTKEQIDIFARSLSIALLFGVIIIALQYFILSIGYLFITTGDSIKIYTSSYFYIYIWAAPAILGMYALNGWYVGMQNAKVPMYVAIIINTINIVLGFTFVYGLGMKIEGIALASVCAQYVGFLLSLFICRYQYKHLIKKIDLNVLTKLAGFIPFFKVNSNIFIRTLALVAVTTCFMSASARAGDDILSANAVLMQFFILFSYMMDGFAYAAEALTGKYVGANHRSQLKILVRYLFIWGAVVVLLFSTIYILFAKQILQLLTDKADIIALCYEYRWWVILFPIAGFAAFLWDGVFVGATASRQMRNSMLIASASFFVIYFIFFNNISNNILWFAFIMYLALRGIVQSLMAPSILNGSK